MFSAPPFRPGRRGGRSVAPRGAHFAGRRRCLATPLLAGLLAAGCGGESGTKQPDSAPTVTAASPLVKRIVEWDEYTGRLEAIEFVEVRARVSGYLQSIHFQEGQIVSGGDLLFVIDPRPFQAELNGATATLHEARSRLEEARALLGEARAQKEQAEAQLALSGRKVERAKQAGNAVSREELDQREAEYLKARADVEASDARIASAQAGISTTTAAIELARAGVETARLHLDYTRVRAPLRGRISKRYVTEGNLISGGTAESTLLTTITSTDPIHCTFDASEQEVLKYTRLALAGARKSSREFKNPVYVALADEAGYPHVGHMDFVDNRIDPNTATMRARAILPNSEALLVPGLFVTLRIPGSGAYEAVLIPDSAVGTDQADRFVYVVDDSGLVSRRVVSLGPIVDGLRVVRSGLRGEERIVIRGVQRARPGARVTALPGAIEATDDGLPDEYEPLPPEKWLNVTVDPPPEDGDAGPAREEPQEDSGGQSPAPPPDERPDAVR